MTCQQEVFCCAMAEARTCPVVDPGCVGCSEVLLNTVELDIAHEVGAVRCRLGIVEPPM